MFLDRVGLSVNTDREVAAARFDGGLGESGAIVEDEAGLALTGGANLAVQVILLPLLEPLGLSL